MKKNIKSKGRPRLPRDPSGAVIGKNYKKPAAPVNLFFEAIPEQKPTEKNLTESYSGENADDFSAAIAAAKEKIKTETAQISESSPPATEKTEQVESVVKVGTADWTELSAVAWQVLGGVIATKTKIDEMQFTEKETEKLAAATNDILNVMFPDLAALTPKEKALLVSGMAIVNVASAKLTIYNEKKNKKTETKSEAPADIAAA